MREIIINLIEKLILPKYDLSGYHVVGTNDFRNSGYGKDDYGYTIRYDFKNLSGIKSDQVVKDIVDDTTTFLRMLGLHGIGFTKLVNSVFIEGIES
jgi:hypothetical protein